MDGFGVSSALFCEQCGLDRDQLGDASIAPFRECPSCARAVCPNCWNLVRKSCLRCAPFSLATRVPTTIVPVPRAVPDAAPATAVGATAKQKPKKAPKLPRRGKVAAAAAATVAIPAASDREVAWPVHAGATVTDAPWPTTGSAPEPIRAPVRPARVSTRRRGRPSGFSSVAGIVVVFVALFGVAGFALAAFGRLPAAGGAGAPAGTQDQIRPDDSSGRIGPIRRVPDGRDAEQSDRPGGDRRARHDRYDRHERRRWDAGDTGDARRSGFDRPAGRVDAEADRHGRRHGDGDRDRHADRHRRADTDTHPGSDPDADAGPHARTHARPDADPDPGSDAGPHPDPDPDPGSLTGEPDTARQIARYHRVMAATPDLAIVPLTAERFGDLAALFEEGGDPKWCWCKWQVGAQRGLTRS